jgi:hypothetical protein
MSLVCSRWAHAALHTSHILIVLPADATMSNPDSSSSSSSSSSLLSNHASHSGFKEFSDLESAISYALVGDTIYLKPGHHWVNKDILISKSIRIIGQDISTTSSSLSSSSSSVAATSTLNGGMSTLDGSGSGLSSILRGVIGSSKPNASSDPSRYVIELNATLKWNAPSGYLCGLSFRRPKPIPGVITHCIHVSKFDLMDPHDEDEEDHQEVEDKMDGAAPLVGRDPLVGCLFVNCNINNMGAHGACVLVDKGAVTAFYSCSISHATTSGKSVYI